MMGIASYGHWIVVGIVLLVFFGGRQHAVGWIKDIGGAFKGLMSVTRDATNATNEVTGALTDARDSVTGMVNGEVSSLKTTMSRDQTYRG